MNRKYLIPVLIVFSLVLVVTAGIVYSVTRSGDVEASFVMSGGDSSSFGIFGGEVIDSGTLSVLSQTSVNVPISINTEVSPVTSEATHEVEYLLDNTGGVCGGGSLTCEKRMFIQASDVGISTLSDLDSISWDVDVLNGYIAHVDVILETDALVFEYAKVDAPCDNVPYPTGVQNTFGDKGIVDSDAKAWLSSGVAGYCGLPEFDNNHKSLTDWKAVRGSEKVIGFEIEVDNWITESNSVINNVSINGFSVEPTLLPGQGLDFRVMTEFSIAIEPDTYAISTDAVPDKTRV